MCQRKSHLKLELYMEGGAKKAVILPQANMHPCLLLVLTRKNKSLTLFPMLAALEINLLFTPSQQVRRLLMVHQPRIGGVEELLPSILFPTALEWPRFLLTSQVNQMKTMMTFLCKIMILLCFIHHG